MAALLALAASSCLLLALAPASALAVTGSISGTVTDAETTEPVEGVEVCAWPLNFENEEEFFGPFCEDTDASGEYALSEVPDGEYEVEFWGVPEGYVVQFYNGKAHWWEADPVTVEGGPVTGIDAELERAAGIEGIVNRSSDGEPVEEVEVCAWPAGEEETFVRCAETASDGSYLIEGLEPGNYKVEFWPVFSGQNLAFQFYDHKARWSEADVISLESGETASEVDADLEAGATISGHVSSAASGAGLFEIPVCAIDAASGELQICNWTEPGGAYELPFLPSNQYKVVFSIDFEEWFGEEGFEEDDGYPTQFWDNQTTLAAANVIPLSTGQSIGGIDARLGTPVPPVVTPPPTTPPVAHHKKHKRCRKKGYVKKKVKGKVRCVKRHKHRHRRHHRGVARPFGYQSPLFPSTGTQRPPFRVVR